MNANVSEIARLHLWSLLLSGGHRFVSDIEVELPEAIGCRLELLGLIERQHRDDGLYLRVTEVGQDWLESQMNQEIQPGSPLAAEVLTKFMHRLSERLRLDESSLTQWTHASESKESDNDWLNEFTLDLQFDEAAPEAVWDGDSELLQRVRSAYLTLSGQRLNVPVRLSALRQTMPDVSRSVLDSALMLMELENLVWFATLEDPQERSTDDINALLNVSGISRDLIYLEK